MTDVVRNVRSTLNESSRRRLTGRSIALWKKGADIAMPHKVLTRASSCVRPCVPEALALKKTPAFDKRASLESAGVDKQLIMFARWDVIFSQGDPCDSVMFIRAASSSTG